MNHSVLITDFDGTITEHDFFALIRDRYMAPDAPDYLARWRSGQMTHFEAMASYFSHAPEDPVELDALMRRTQPDPDLQKAASRLARCGWDLVVVSAGSSWYIERILAACGVAAQVHSNPGSLEEGRGLVLELPYESPFLSKETGIDKEAVVRDALDRYDRVAYAGDGRPDIAPSLLVRPEFRFARGFLATELTRRNKTFRPFGRWAEIVHHIAC